VPFRRDRVSDEINILTKCQNVGANDCPWMDRLVRRAAGCGASGRRTGRTTDMGEAHAPNASTWKCGRSVSGAGKRSERAQLG
jgi:hypothetical protein